jgi:PAS domain S-box-containing protein
LSRINNELVNLQRDLARSNAHLAVANGKLEASEQRYRSLSACSPIGILEMDAADRCLYTNSHWQAFSGLTAEESLGGGWHRALDQRTAPDFLKERELALHAGQEFSREVRFVNTRGDQCWAQVCSRVIPAEDGKVTGRVSTVADITERKKAETELRWKTGLLESYVNHSIDGILITNPQGRKIFQNHRLVDLFKVPPPVAADKDGTRQLEWVSNSNRDPEQFLARVTWLKNHPDEISRDEIEQKDGTFLDRYTSPVTGSDGTHYGRLWMFRDITARKRVEVALRDSEQRMRLQTVALETCANGVAITDVKGTIQWVNEAFARLTGYSAIELKGQNPRILKSGKQSESFYKEMWQTLCLGGVWFGEIINRHKTGRLYCEEMTITPVRDEGGRIAHFIAVKEDITERKRAEEALKEQFALREKLAKIAANAPGLIYSLRLRPDGSSCLPYVSPTIEGFCGLRAQDLVDDATAFFELIHVGDYDRFQKSIAESARAMLPWRAEFRVQHPQRGLFWVEGQSTPEREADGSILWHGFVSDITERKRTEEALRESEEKFRQLADNITDVFWMTSPDLSTIHYISPGYELIWGRSVESLYANPYQWVEAILPEERERVFAIFATLMEKSEPQVSVEHRIARPDGSVRWIHNRGFPVRDVEGNLIRLTGIATDITERKRSAQELAYHKQNEERARLALENEQKLSLVKSRFVSLVSHEFRTPLCVINTAAQLLDHYLDQMSGPERSGELGEIQKSVERMTQMMNDFLVYGNCTGGKLEFKPARVDLAALCWQIIGEIPSYAGSPHPIEFTIDPTLREVWLDEKILRHILGNLLSNAVKYSIDGQPVTLQAIRVAGNSELPGDTRVSRETQLELKISDTGIGIPASDLTKLFENFHRAANVGNRPGTGLGLAIVKQFVDLHQGTIRVASEVGKGTTVWVRLPIAAPLVAVFPHVPGQLEKPGAGMAVNRELEPTNSKN